MGRRKQASDEAVVAKVRTHKNVIAGRPAMVRKARSKVAFPMTGGMSNASMGNMYSPEMSTDMLELPQSPDEKRRFNRHFYENDPFVGQAIDIHTELPLSKVRLTMPRAKNRELAERSLRFCTKWSDRINLLQRLIEIVHEYHLQGEVNIFCEDISPDMPQEIRQKCLRTLQEDGTLTEEWLDHDDADERAVAWLKKNYKGWSALRVLPPEQVEMESFPFTDEKLMYLKPDSDTQRVVTQAQSGDPYAQRVVDSMPQDVVAAIKRGGKIPLNTDPDAGSFVCYLARKKSQYEPRGHSILQRCMRVLVHRDKLRQSQASIASRHMTPIRLIWAENASVEDVEELRDQVDMALMDPDYSIVTNFQVNWEEMGSDQRLLDLSSEYDQSDKQLYAGLGVTESLLSGESSYSGDRINLEVINTRYMLLRELVQTLVEDNFLAPMCRRMGFIEIDEDGDEIVIFPRLSFTRLALRDNQDVFDALFSLYQKGSLPIAVILDLLNIDPVATAEALHKDQWTINDSQANEMMRTIWGDAGTKLAENSNVIELIAKNLGVKYTAPADEGGSRF